MVSSPPVQRRRLALICPDFVLELASESDDVEKLRRKMQEYVENGTLGLANTTQ